jgi:redox-sensitive bicupin YhaK (pirin superfamily)
VRVSNFESDVELADVTGAGEDLRPLLEVLSPRSVLLGPRQEVRRVLPNKDRRMIGAWCFVDHYGPEDITDKVGMRVPPHPHSGLQTVSWLFDGEVHHRDSLGSDALVQPGQLNLMTSGPGIAHSEESPPGHSAIMHGIQLWVALPEGARHDAPRDFTQYRDLPRIERHGLRATVVTGEFEGAVSPALTFTPLVGVELVVSGDATVDVFPDYEYGLLAIDAGLIVEGAALGVSEIAYLGGRRESLRLRSADGARRAFLLGGAPFEEQLVMWWNFIGRSHDEIVEFRRSWNEAPDRLEAGRAADEGRPGSAVGGPFGVVRGFAGDRLIAPPMPTIRLKSRGRRR